jgi:hypothetical protein
MHKANDLSPNLMRILKESENRIYDYTKHFCFECPKFDTHTERIRERYLGLLDTFVSLTCLFFGTHLVHRQLIQLGSDGKLYCAEHCSSEKLSNFVVQSNFLCMPKKISIWG